MKKKSKATPASRRHRSWLAGLDRWLLLAVLIGIVVRAWQFGDLPPGMNQDEASTMYDAFSLLHYGIDRNGITHPIVLISWGSGMALLPALIQMPFLLLEPTVTMGRLPFLLAGIAAIPLLFLLLRDTWDLRAARIGALLLAVSPWHIMLSRWGLDSNLLPFVFLLATVVLVRSLKKPELLPVAGALYALCLYCYGTAYAVVPLFLGGIALLGLHSGMWSKRWMTVAGVCTAVVALPIILFLVINAFGWESLQTPLFTIPRLTGTPRYETMGNLDVLSASFYQDAWGNLKNAGRLLLTQHDGLIWNGMEGYGVLYPFSSGIAVIGFLLLCHAGLRKKGSRSGILLCWCAASLLLCALVSVNINRANIAMLPFVFCTAIAIAALSKHRAVLAGIAVIFGLSFLAFCGAYFGGYRAQAAESFFASFDEAIHAAAAYEGPVCVTGNVNMPYIFVLFHTREDPRVFRDTVVYENPGAEFQGVSSYGRYTFGLHRCMPGADTVIASNDETEQYDFSGYSRTVFERYTVLRRLPPS